MAMTADRIATIGCQQTLSLHRSILRWSFWAALSLGTAVISTRPATAQGIGEDETAAPSGEADGFFERLPNIALSTAGGTQLWTDHRNVAGWRIQQNSLTGHWRLLDSEDVRHCWGSRTACEAALSDATMQDAADVPPDHVVVLLHGLMRTRHSMSSLEQHLEKETDAHVIRFSYASTRFEIAEHAAALREVVEGLPGNPRVDFVGHSMGNIIVRHAIADWQADPHTGREVLSRLGRVVMLGPPNQGAAIARRLGTLGVFETVVGPGAMQLGLRWAELEEQLAVPPCPFAIVAGDLPEVLPRNPLVDGDSDFVVSVAEARLKGAAEFHTLPLLHSVLMDHPRVQKIVVDFLTQ